MLSHVEQGVVLGDAALQRDVRPRHPARQLVHEAVLAAFLDVLDADAHLQPADLHEAADLHAVDLEQERGRR